jgi:GNAT superfamily N-acetyltransferase
LTDRGFRVERVDARRLHDLRRRVLRGDRPEAPVADPRDDEPTALHLAGFEGERLVVSVSFYPSNPPVNPGLATYQLRYMATEFDVQGRGYGATVLAFAEDELRALGAEQMWANARDSALGFYLSTDWSSVEGSEHLSSETQLPHTVIFKRLVAHSSAVRS